MKNAHVLAIGAAALIGCGGSSHILDGGDADMKSGDAYDCSSSSVTCAAVTGFSVDIDLLSKYFHDNPDATASEIIQNACTAGTPVTARYEDDTTKFTETVTTDTAVNLCGFSLKAVVGKTIHLVAKENAATKVLNTFSQDITVVASSGAAMQPAHVCTSNKYSAPVGVAATLGSGTTVDIVEQHGICMYGTNDNFTPPFVKLTPSTVGTVTPSGFTVYSMTDPSTMPPTFVQQADGPLGIHGIYDASNSVETTVTVNATADSGTNVYAPFTCTVIPGYITFAPENPNQT